MELLLIGPVGFLVCVIAGFVIAGKIRRWTRGRH